MPDCTGGRRGAVLGTGEVGRLEESEGDAQRIAFIVFLLYPTVAVLPWDPLHVVSECHSLVCLVSESLYPVYSCHLPVSSWNTGPLSQSWESSESLPHLSALHINLLVLPNSCFLQLGSVRSSARLGPWIFVPNSSIKSVIGPAENESFLLLLFVSLFCAKFSE